MNFELIESKSELEIISDATGQASIECSCSTCKNMCIHTSCLGTPKDIEAIIDAGFGQYIKHSIWGVGFMMGFYAGFIDMYQLESTDKGCVLYKNGKCMLHRNGLKPIEGKLATHDGMVMNMFNYQKALPWNVAKTWLDESNKEIIERIKQKLDSK